jgi:hypothetical protein
MPVEGYDRKKRAKAAKRSDDGKESNSIEQNDQDDGLNFIEQNDQAKEPKSGKQIEGN